VILRGQTIFQNASLTGASASVNLPAGAAAGDIAIVIAGVFGGTGGTLPAGWTATGWVVPGGGTYNTNSWSKTLTAGDVATGNVTLTMAFAAQMMQLSIVLVEGTSTPGLQSIITGDQLASPLDVSTTNAAAAGAGLLLLFCSGNTGFLYGSTITGPPTVSTLALFNDTASGGQGQDVRLAWASAGVTQGPQTFTFTGETTDSAGHFALIAVFIPELATSTASSSFTARTMIAPPLEPNCLPEGKKFAILEIDWTQVPITPLNANSPYVDLDEVIINGGSANGPNQANFLSGYQVVQVSLDQLVSGGETPLSQCVSCMFHDRASYGIDAGGTDQTAADFSYPAEEISQLYVTSVSFGQTFCVPQVLGPRGVGVGFFLYNIADGCQPFFVGSNGLIRVVRTCENRNNAAQLGWGKTTLTFSNFPIPPFLHMSVPTEQVIPT
jgi:hypothetical protein